MTTHTCSCLYCALTDNVVSLYLLFQDSEKQATKQRISELEEMITQLKDELADKVCVMDCLQ